MERPTTHLVNTFIKKLPITIALFLLNSFAIAQNIVITGTIVEKATSQPVPYATIVVKDSTLHQNLNGVISDENGTFSVSSPKSSIYIEVSFMGYATITVSDITVINQTANLGNITLEQDKQTLDAVEIRGEVSKTVFKLDKRVFNVGKDLSTSGASALEVLNSVPSVNVSIEGDISLRGSSGVQILINGKPSVLADGSNNALGTITADMIEKIEVITNPSAKYDASGTAGILNIILKKEDEKGWNGSISLNTGLPDNHSFGVSVNRRTKKFNLFAQAGAGYRSLPKEFESVNRNLLSDEVVSSTGKEYRNEMFTNLRLGTDYHINDLNVLTLSGNVAYEVEDQPSAYYFGFIDGNNETLSTWLREETTEATNPKYQYEFNYNKQFKKNKEHTLQFSALGSFFGKEQASQFTNTTLTGTDIDENQQTETKFNKADYTFKADYVNPLNKLYTIETGAQYVINDVGNDFEVRNLINEQYVVSEALTNSFDWNQDVLGVYATAAYEKSKLGIKAGLRLEHTDVNTFLRNTNESNKQQYTNLFPTFHTSYKFGEKLSLQAGYSRRILRPRLWDLNPFFNIRNNFNIRVGNPDLQAEFTNSYELTGIYKLGKVSLSSSLYHRYTTDVVERVATFAENVTYTRPENIGTNSTVGFETNGKYSLKKWLTINGDVNYNYFNRDGSFQNQVFDISGSQWTSSLGSKISLPYSIDFELTGDYRSGYKTVQGERSGFAFMNIGVRKKLLKGKTIVNLGIRDVFASRIEEVFVNNASFESYSYSLRGRFLTFGISYGFGKGEAMTYSGRRR